MRTIYVFVGLLVISVCLTEGFLLSKKNDTATKAPKKEKCMIVKGKGKNLIGDTIFINKDFAATLKKIDDAAKQCMVKLSITGSYEQLPDASKVFKFTTAHVGHHLRFIVMDKTGKNLVCNKICLTKEGEKIPEVKCLATHFRRENLRFGPHGEVGAVDDASDVKPGFADIARRTQDACKGAKI